MVLRKLDWGHSFLFLNVYLSLKAKVALTSESTDQTLLVWHTTK